MTDRNCKDCIFFRDKEDGFSCGTCKYPVPTWVKLSSGGGFVAGYEAKECATFKSMSEAINKAMAETP